MKKILILLAYILLFWIFIPVLLLYSSSALDRIIDFRKIYNIPLTAGAFLLAISVPMLVISIIQYKRFTGELPVSAFAPKAIIRKGLYNYWRHPIYLFYVMTFIAIALIIRSQSMLLIVMPVFILITFIYIVGEERILKKRFGKSYDYYKRITGLVFPVLYQLLRYPALLFFKSFFRYSVKNNSLIPDSPPYFIVCEHKNYLDPFFIAAAVHHPISFIATYEVYRSAVLQIFMKTFFGVPKKRFRHDYASIRRMAEIIDSNGVIGLFPEGERSWTGETQNFKPEVLKLLLKMHRIPILPVKIHGSYHAWPRWSEGMRSYRITVDFKEPFFPDQHLTPEELEKQIMLVLGETSHPEKLTKRPVSTGTGIEKVLYMCNECGQFNTFKGNRNLIKCKDCGLELGISDDLTIDRLNSGKKETLPIGAYYNLIRISPENITRKNKISGKCIFSVESGKRFINLIDGELRMDTDKMIIDDSRKHFILYYNNIGSVTTESNCKLQLFDTENNKLYQLEFPSASILLWQDIITSSIILKTGRSINTR